MGSLTGLIMGMATLPDFHEAFKKIHLKELGLYWQQAIADHGGKWTNTILLLLLITLMIG